MSAFAHNAMVVTIRNAATRCDSDIVLPRAYELAVSFTSENTNSNRYQAAWYPSGWFRLSQTHTTALVGKLSLSEAIFCHNAQSLGLSVHY
jgi:hypothetical protein